MGPNRHTLDVSISSRVSDDQLPQFQNTTHERVVNGNNVGSILSKSMKKIAPKTALLTKE